MINRNDILEIEYDNEVQGLGGIRGAEWALQFHRAVQDSSWELGMIQADQVSPGEHEVVVCVVDSGLAEAHPDFTQENVNGTDTVKFYGDPWSWGNDGMGHGKLDA